MSHWAIYLCITPGDGDHRIYQANGQENDLALEVSPVNPRRSRRMQRLIFVSDIHRTSDVDEQIPTSGTTS